MAAQTGPSTTRDDLARSFQTVSEILALSVFGIGAMVLAGWIFDVPILKSISPDYVAMKANTAIGFILSGFALWLLQEKRAGPVKRRLANACAAGVAALGMLSLAEYVTGFDFGIDQLLFTEAEGALFTPYPGRMALITAYNFSFIGVAILVRDMARGFVAAQTLMLIEGVLSFASVISYMFGVPGSYPAFITFWSVAVHTAVAFLLIFFSFCFVWPDRGIFSILVSDGPGGYLSRRVLPLALMLSPFVAYFTFQGEVAGLYDPWFESALHTVLVTIMLVGVVTALSRTMDKEDRERKMAGELLARQQKLASIGTLSAGVAHEILNPLNIIGVVAQTMQTEEWPPETRENLDTIMRQVRRATKITNDLRQFSHQGKPTIEAVNIHALFDQTAALIERDLFLDNVTIHRDFGTGIPIIYTDEDLMAQIFLNVLNNARDAFKEFRDGRKRRFTVKTRAAFGHVEIELSDNGPGIPKEHIAKIFDPFFTTKEAGQGTGLGLSIAHSIIEKQGGEMTVESEEGKGATFRITLPVKGMPSTGEDPS